MTITCPHNRLLVMDEIAGVIARVGLTKDEMCWIFKSLETTYRGDTASNG